MLFIWTLQIKIIWKLYELNSWYDSILGYTYV